VSRGRLLGFSGIDGSGKTTQVKALQAALERSGYADVVPVKTQWSAFESIHLLSESLFGDRHDYHPDIPATLREFVVSCDVVQFSKTVLGPLLERGATVLWDRTPLCYRVYGACYRADMRWPNQLLELVEQPELTVLLDVDPGLARTRIESRSSKPAQSNEGYELLRAVREEYLRQAARMDAVTIVDAAAPAAVVTERIEQLVVGRLAMSGAS
jgi:dTMP kinase